MSNVYSRKCLVYFNILALKRGGMLEGSQGTPFGRHLPPSTRFLVLSVYKPTTIIFGSFALLHVNITAIYA